MDEIAIWNRRGDGMTQSGFSTRILRPVDGVNAVTRIVFERLGASPSGKSEHIGFYGEQYASSCDTWFAAGRTNMLGWSLKLETPLLADHGEY